MNTEMQERLISLFREAVAQLEYCNYGDEWERSCAKADKLPERLNEMLEELEAEGL